MSQTQLSREQLFLPLRVRAFEVGRAIAGTRERVDEGFAERTLRGRLTLESGCVTSKVLAKHIELLIGPVAAETMCGSLASSFRAHDSTVCSNRPICPRCLAVD